jgi:hypothetical protein
MAFAGASCKVMTSGTSGSSAKPSPEASTTPSAATAEATTSPQETAATPSKETADENVIKLQGTIGNIPVHMTIVITDGKITGSYYDDKVKQEIKLDGTIEENRMISLKEYDKNGVAATFDGWYVPGIRITGVWTIDKTKETFDFALDVIGGIPANALWSGEWKRMDTGRFSSATLVIFNELDSSFDFQIDAFNGANMGFINGTATYDGKSAYYQNNSTGEKVTFTMEGKIIELSANYTANGNAGAGVTYDGKYTKGDLPEDTLLSMGYVSDEAQDNAFKAMVGKDYDLFLNTANIHEDGEDMDNLDATVTMWWVHGFGGSNESIVMYLPDGKLCAAVIDADHQSINVYTNASYITEVPETIKAWARSFPDLTIALYNNTVD